MVTIEGARFSGLGQASETVAAQMEGISRGFPEFRRCHPATINVEFDQPLVVRHPDHDTGLMPWFYRGELIDRETFKLLRIVFEAVCDPPVTARGWIYISSGAPYGKMPRQHEIVLERWIEIPTECRCAVHIDREHHEEAIGEQRTIVI